VVSNPIVVAIDGPAASGKGTIARQVAERFNLDYLDTGSIYRAVGYKILHQEQDPSDESVAVSAAKSLTAEELKNPNLYDEGVGAAASKVAAIPAVREVLLEFQQSFAKSPKGAILDGRDIATVVCPHADFKFYITADIATRARRRYKQLQNKDSSVIYQAVLDDLNRRDARDSEREIAPLKQAQDAIAIDTTELTIAEVVQRVTAVIAEKS
jgi:cytidylate kinase